MTGTIPPPLPPKLLYCEAEVMQHCPQHGLNLMVCTELFVNATWVKVTVTVLVDRTVDRRMATLFTNSYSTVLN